MITIAPNSWPGFGGLYHSPGEEFSYIINNRVYNINLERYNDDEINNIVTNWNLVPSFEVDPQGSDILIIESYNKYMLYQKRSNGLFVELIPRMDSEPFARSEVSLIKIPFPNGWETDNIFMTIELEQIDDTIFNRLNNISGTYDEILSLLNQPIVTNPRMITIAPNTWPGFGGLFYNNADGGFDYIIHSLVYNTDLQRTDQYTVNEVLSWSLVPSFEVDTQSSDILIIESDNRYMLYQQIDGVFVELLPRQPGSFDEYDSYRLVIPSDDGVEIEDEYSAIQLDTISQPIFRRLNGQPATYDEILSLLNQPRSTYQASMIATSIYNPNRITNQRPLDDMYNEILNQQRPLDDMYNEILNQQRNNTTNTLFKESYETLLKKLYNLPVLLPEFLTINGTKINFIPFSQVSSIQIQSYKIDPLLQPWSDKTNKIITLFDSNGTTYLVKAQYDPVTNQIFPPI